MYISVSRPTDHINAVFSQYYGRSDHSHRHNFSDKNNKKNDDVVNFDALFEGIFDRATSTT